MATERINGWCALCRSRCGCISVVEDGRLVAVEPDREHPTGQSLCAKGQAAPEQVYSADRILYPMMRTRPKGEPDPGWQRISWEQALDTIAERMKTYAAQDGRESVAFAVTTGSGTAISDNSPWISRFIRAFGAANNCYGTEICNWHKDVATTYTYGVGVGTPDIDNAGCMLLWGHNPNAAWLAQGQRIARAKRRGLKVVVVDPRKVGPAIKANAWLRVRPGTDGALALGLANQLLQDDHFDQDFAARLTNAPYLVHPTENRLLDNADLADLADLAGTSQEAPAGTSPSTPLVWDRASSTAVPAPEPAAGYDALPPLRGEFQIQTAAGPLTCQTVLSHFESLAQGFPPERVERECGIPAADVIETARLLWQSRPVSYYAWSGVGQHANATQTDRAICVLYTLLGSIDAPGGNAQLQTVPTTNVATCGLPEPDALQKALGRDERPLGPPKDGWCTSRDLYHSILEAQPYATRALINFGVNLLVSHAGVELGAKALSQLGFYAHADLYLTPTANYADIFLPINTPWERESVRVGFEVTPQAHGLVQHRRAAVESRGESRDDGWVVFELARRLGLDHQFWNGDMDAAWSELLAPAGITLDALKAAERGIQVELGEPHNRYRQAGFPTPSGRIEIWSETFRTHGYPPLPVYVAPTWAKMRAGANGCEAKFPLILTSAKSSQYCHSQFRNLPKLRRRAADPEIQIHPDTANNRGLAAGDWAEITTPSGAIKARVALSPYLDTSVVVGEHGWWQSCKALGLPAYPERGPGSANFNLLIDDADADPISGSTPNRSYVCEVSAIGAA